MFFAPEIALKKRVFICSQGPLYHNCTVGGRDSVRALVHFEVVVHFLTYFCFERMNILCHFAFQFGAEDCYLNLQIDREARVPGNAGASTQLKFISSLRKCGSLQ